MRARIDLHNDLLLLFTPNVYFQPPSDIRMKFPCIVYSKVPNKKEYASDGIYKKTQEYQLTLMEINPDSILADQIESYFPYCSINSYSVVDGLHHTFINLFY